MYNNKPLTISNCLNLSPFSRVSLGQTVVANQPTLLNPPRYWSSKMGSPPHSPPPTCELFHPSWICMLTPLLQCPAWWLAARHSNSWRGHTVPHQRGRSSSALLPGCRLPQAPRAAQVSGSLPPLPSSGLCWVGQGWGAASAVARGFLGNLG